MKFITGLTIFIILCTAGCTAQNSPAQKPQVQQQQLNKENVVINTELAGRVEEIAETVESVEDSIAVIINRDVSVAIKVTGFDRLRLKSIRREVHEKITELAPEYTVHVTTDKKLFSELQKLEKQIQQGGNPSTIITKQQKINKDMRG